MSVSGSTGKEAADTAAAGASPPATSGNPVRLLQLTDLHLYAKPDGRLLGQNTRRTFNQVLAHARERHWPPDAIVLTGDLVHDERLDGYHFLQQCLAGLRVPYFCIPGNHDRIDLLASYVDRDAIASLRTVAVGGWQLVLLDSTIPFEEGGHLTRKTLKGLDGLLARAPERHTLACLHHQPVPIGSRWMDSMMVNNGAALMTVAERRPNLRGILWGHVHQAFQKLYHGTLLMATPSTCVQFMPGSETFELDHATPGYRWLHLHSDGRIDTGIERIDAYPDPLVQWSHGY